MLVSLLKKTVLFCCLLLAYSTGQSQYLQIIHLGLGHGDCTFIIAQEEDDGPVYTVMIDFLGTGKEAFDAVRYEFENNEKLENLDEKVIDYVIITHPHTDHFQGFTAFNRALKAYNNKNKNDQITISNYITREQIDLSVGTTLEEEDQLLCNGVITTEDDEENEDEYEDEGYSDEEADDMVEEDNALNLNAIRNAGTRYEIHQTMDFDDPEIEANFNEEGSKWTQCLNALSEYEEHQVHLGDNLFGEYFTENKVSMICVVGNGQVVGHNTPFLKEVANGEYTTTSPNDLSVGFILNCETFTYLTMGDLGGVNAGGYKDGETGVANALTEWLTTGKHTPNMHICALKLGHHGSEHSTRPSFCQKLKPTFGVIQAAKAVFSGTRLPHEVAITNFKDNADPVTLFYTYYPKGNYVQSTDDYDGFDDEFYEADVKAYQDIQIIVNQPSDGNNYPQDVELEIGYRLRTMKKKVQKGDYEFYQFIKTESGESLDECTKGHAWSRFYKK